MDELRNMLKEATTTICRLCKEIHPWHKDCTSCDEIEMYREALAAADIPPESEG